MVVLKNLTTKKVITRKAKIASTFTDRLFGLINPQNPRIMIFHTHFGIHTFFMTKSIDVLVIDNSGNVVKLKKHLKPFYFFLYHPKYSTVIEMPENTIDKFQIRINDKISIG